MGKVTPINKGRKKRVDDHMAFDREETKLLDEYVAWSRAHGHPEMTRVAAMRVLITDGLRAFKESQENTPS